MAVTYQVVITPDAQVCIREIIDYVLDNASVEAANKVSRAINDKIQSLKTFPERIEIRKGSSKNLVEAFDFAPSRSRSVSEETLRNQV